MTKRFLCIAIFFRFVSGQGNVCDQECNLIEDMFSHPQVKCGKIVSNHPIYGPKCVYLTKTR